MKACPHCGTANPNTAEFCMNCRGGLARSLSQRGETDLSTGDWVLCVLCSGIACILGIVRLIQGKPNAGKMIGVSILFVILWTGVRILLTVAMNGR
jgi:hypothetical protein